MMEKLQKRGDALARQHLADARSEIKSALTAELPENARVTETPGGVQVEAPQLGKQLIENGSLRDVAFLMRGVR
ncbi:hypothetical protein [Parasphingorhabdus sp.]|uniref:hypothetical protein n=1 Tax=Parasphingorhabdus sp. TaxID=2709688 RepID=UPI003A90F28D